MPPLPWAINQVGFFPFFFFFSHFFFHFVNWTCLGYFLEILFHFKTTLFSVRFILHCGKFSYRRRRFENLCVWFWSVHVKHLKFFFFVFVPARSLDGLGLNEWNNFSFWLLNTLQLVTCSIFPFIFFLLFVLLLFWIPFLVWQIHTMDSWIAFTFVIWHLIDTICFSNSSEFIECVKYSIHFHLFHVRHKNSGVVAVLRLQRTNEKKKKNTQLCVTSTDLIVS